MIPLDVDTASVYYGMLRLPMYLPMAIEPVYGLVSKFRTSIHICAKRVKE